MFGPMDCTVGATVNRRIFSATDQLLCKNLDVRWWSVFSAFMQHTKHSSSMSRLVRISQER